MAKEYVCDKCGRRETYYFLHDIEISSSVKWELCYSCQGGLTELATKYVEAGPDKARR